MSDDPILDGAGAERLMQQAKAAAGRAYAPYSRFAVGAALRFSGGQVFTGSNFENASYGLSICAETAAVLAANQAGFRKGLEAVAVYGGPMDSEGNPLAGQEPITPCGRCRQILSELAQLGGTNPVIYCGHASGWKPVRLDELLPFAFGPASL